MRIYKRKYRKDGKNRETDNYYIDFKDHREIVRTLPDSPNKEQAENTVKSLEKLIYLRVTNNSLDSDMMSWLEGQSDKRLAKLAEWDIIPQHLAGGAKKLSEHINEWGKYLEAKGNTKKHAHLLAKRMRSICGECGFHYPRELNDGKLLSWLHGMIESKSIGITTANHYMAAAKNFGNWLARSGIVINSPFRFMKKRNNAGKYARVRRDLNPEECIRLLEATTKAKQHHGMSGPERALLYRVAIETGLRWSELRSLLVRNLSLNSNTPMLTVDAAYTKNRRRDSLPLRSDTANLLAEHCQNLKPEDRVFHMWKEDGAACIRRDLALAGIPYKDDVGRVVDFHATRHTFASHMLIAKVAPGVAQRLARHSSIIQTMDIYTHAGFDALAEAVNSLPAKEGKKAAPQADAQAEN